MEKIKGIKVLNKIENLLNKIYEKIPEIKKEITNYKQRFKIEKYEEKENETLEEQKLKAENILDRTLQLKQRNDFCFEIFKEIKNLYEESKQCEEILKNDSYQYIKFNNSLIEIINKKDDEITNKKIEQLKNENKKRKTETNKLKVEIRIKN